MSLHDACNQLGWPSPDAIFMPVGAGPAVYADLARQKIQQSLRRLPDAQDVRVGVLTRDPTADATEEPLAVVCEFRSSVSPRTLEEVHRLAWNFCRSKIVVIVEPHLVRAWTCCEPPTKTPLVGPHPAEIETLVLSSVEGASLASQAVQSLHWLRLVSGDFIQSHPKRFRDDGRADRRLLENLRAVREELVGESGAHEGLVPDVAHDLLARIIFIQFLFDRKDANGRPALGEQELRRLNEDGILSARYTTLGHILRHYSDAYRLFRWLNSKFNGDLFPGKGTTKTQREAEWRREMQQVQPAHLKLLALFVEGKLELMKGRSRQANLWPFYSFDAIPLEFISSIYEVFVGPKKGVHYTPGYLVDFILDGVLPWEDDDWDLRVLDPACGSGIFLVKVFQRLVHRWRRTHPGEVPRAVLLKQLLTRNIFGVDIDEHAVRVASFSLYLAMCDEIDPRHYWNRMRFPPLRGRRLISADFFDEKAGFRTAGEVGRYDLVIGNAPWGQASATDLAVHWAATHRWPIANQGIGTLFLAKAAALARPSGRVAMVTSASTLLFNRNKTAEAFRRALFTFYSFEEVINLSAVRFGVFPNAKSAACIVVFQPVPPTSDRFSYICPKPLASGAGGDWIVVEPGDVQTVYSEEAASDPWVWTALLWGGRRDLELVRRLSRGPRLDAHVLHKRKGIVRGDRQKPEPDIVGRHILEVPEFPANTFLRLRARDLPINRDPGTDEADSTTMVPFQLPQLIIKKAWSAESRRFRAVLVDGDRTTKGVICTQAYVSVHVPDRSLAVLEAACLTMNSAVAVYFLFLTSGQSASFIPSALVEELLSVPLPASGGHLGGLSTFADVDVRAREAFGFKAAEWILIEDFARYTIPQIQDSGSAGWRTSGGRDGDCNDEDLLAYCECFVRVLRDGLGAQAGAVVFKRREPGALPVHLVAVYLDHFSTPSVRFEGVDDQELWARLVDLDQRFLSVRPAGAGGVFFQRTARIYDGAIIDNVRVPVVYFVKPRALRYWSRSVALRDADEVVADAAVWGRRWGHEMEGSGRA